MGHIWRRASVQEIFWNNSEKKCSYNILCIQTTVKVVQKNQKKSKDIFDFLDFSMQTS